MSRPFKEPVMQVDWHSKGWLGAGLGGLMAVGVAILLTAWAQPGPERAAPKMAESSVVRQAPSGPSLQAMISGWPLYFEANQGQAASPVRFLARGPGSTLFLTATEAVLVLKQQSAISGQRSAVNTHDPRPLSPSPSVGAVLRMQLVGANPAPQLVGREELPGTVNSFIGHDPKKWRTRIPTYARVIYTDIYPGIDLVFYGHQGQLEFDFIMAPGADPVAA